MSGVKSIEALTRAVKADPENIELKLELLSLRGRIEGPDAYLSILSCREEWQEAPSMSRRLAVDRVGALLGARFEWIDTKPYSCFRNDQLESYDIASFRHQATGIDFQLIPGSKGLEEDQEALLVSRTLITREQWLAVCSEDPSFKKEAGLPVQGVSWGLAEEWLKAVGDGLRLPKIDEWLSFARALPASASHCFYFGSDESRLGDYAWYWGNSGGRVQPVASKKCNAFGLHDIHGNLWEWTVGMQTKTHRLRMGGAWDCNPERCRFDRRSLIAKDSSFNNLGLRVVRGL